ncbi:hypothetical protein BC835DRAFT_682385 [Cytidiella melzeri]|nr:hypothetical protein BC835DRAFT_682385 [Cytidiella melzeri]
MCTSTICYTRIPTLDSTMVREWRCHVKLQSSVLAILSSSKSPCVLLSLPTTIWSWRWTRTTILTIYTFEKEKEVEILRLIQEELGITSPGLWHFSYVPEGVRRHPWLPPTLEEMYRFQHLLPAAQRAQRSFADLASLALNEFLEYRCYIPPLSLPLEYRRVVLQIVA